MYTLPCVKYLASGKLLYNTGSLTLCSVMTERVGMGVVMGRNAPEGESMYVYLQLIHVVVQQKPTHCKAIILKIKIKEKTIF